MNTGVLSHCSALLFLGVVISSNESAEVSSLRLLDHHQYPRDRFHHSSFNNGNSVRRREQDDVQLSDEESGKEVAMESSEQFTKPLPTHHHHQHGITHGNHIVKEKYCPGCKRDELALRLNSETLRNLRLDRIKEKILHKLRLKEPPSNPSGSKTLPEILIHQANHHHHRVTSESELADDYYGKTEQVIVYAEEELISSCPRGSIPSTCLTFKLPAEVIKEKVDLRVRSAELWVYVLGEGDRAQARVFTIAEISTSDLYNGPLRTSLDPRHLVNSTADGWEAMNVSSAVGAWLSKTLHFRMERSYPPLTLQVGCRNCTKMSQNSASPIDIENSDYQPFLVINMAETIQKNRRRRNTNCQSTPSECCRESFRVSFQQIGWNWILEPKEFDAYYCKGTCSGMVTTQHHSSVIRAHINRIGNITETGQQLLMPCCTPTKLGGITILYTLTNSTSVWKYLPNMVVESCSCS